MTSSCPHHQSHPTGPAQPAGRHGGLPPGPKGRAFRNLRERVLDYRGFMERLNREYGGIVLYALPSGLGNCCALFDAELIREVYVVQEASFPPFQDKASYGIMKTPAIFRSHGEQHRGLKKVADSAFAGERLPAYAELIADDVRVMHGGLRPGRTIDAEAELGRLVRRILLHSIIGRDVEASPDLLKDALDALKWDWALSYLPLNTRLLRRLPLPQNRRCRRVVRALDDIVHEAIRRSADPTHSGDDVITLFVRASELDEMKRLGLFDSTQKIRDEAYSMLLGNMDGPVAAMVCGAYYIDRHPAVRARVEAEVDSVLGDRAITGGDYFRLPYLQAVFQETMRLAPPGYTGNAMLRVAAEDCVVGGYLIPKGSIVQACAGMPHTATEYWDDPGAFEPERWLGEQGPGSARCPEHAYIPFGLQPHYCPAWEWVRVIFTLAFASIAQGLRLEPVRNDPPRIQLLGVGVQGPYPVTVTRRSPGTQPLGQ